MPFHMVASTGFPELGDDLFFFGDDHAEGGLGLVGGAEFCQQFVVEHAHDAGEDLEVASVVMAADQDEHVGEPAAEGVEIDAGLDATKLNQLVDEIGA